MTELVFLHGAPASGKLTVAKALLGMLTGRLLDNHAAIDFARTVFDFGAPGFWHLVHAVRLAALSTAVEHDVPLVVATSCYSEPEDRARFEEFRAVVERGGGRIAPVFLHCPDEEVRRRIGNPDRVQRRKITSVEGWERFTARWTKAPVPQPDCLMINTGQHAPEVVAQEIVRHFALNQTDLAVDGSATVFDVASCRAAARAGHLEDWLHRYLRRGPWANLGLSDGLRRCPRNWIGPVLLRLNALERCCGPEPDGIPRERRNVALQGKCNGGRPDGPNDAAATHRRVENGPAERPRRQSSSRRGHPGRLAGPMGRRVVQRPGPGPRRRAGCGTGGCLHRPREWNDTRRHVPERQGCRTSRENR